ncbi:MAG: hypothetical protein AAB225_02315, partial [Acidobacteriota bacterium]
MNSAGERGTTAPDRPTTRLRTAVGFLVILAAIRLWLMPIGSSLWLDECGTYWVIKDGLQSMYPRSLLLLQSPLYCLTAAAATWVGGLNELALRLPSVLAMIGTAALLYR